MTTDQAKNRLKAILSKPDQGSLPIFIIQIQIGQTSTRRWVRYLVPTGGEGKDALWDITPLIARCFDESLTKDGNFIVKGGNGSDAIESLSVELFGRYDSIPLFSELSRPSLLP